MEEQVKEPISSWNMDGADNGDIMPIASGPVGQLFEVYASKSESDAKALASSKPGAMCFATDTHRIVFNGVVYNLVEIINNLTDGSTNKALSAAQGKALKALVDALPTMEEMNNAINSKLGSVYKVMGTKATIADVLALTNAVKGDTWNVTAEFTLGGKKYPAGTNVVCVTNTSASDHNDDNWDALGGTVDLSVFLKAADAAKTYATKSELTSHTGNKSNPHGVTKAQVGLSNVTNDAQVKRSEVVDDYIDVKEVAAGNTVASTNVTKRIITVQEACVPVLLDQIVGGTQTVQQASSTKAGGSLVYLKDMKQLCYRIDGTYYNNWSIADDSNKAKQYAELAGSDGLARKPIEGKVYVMPSAGSFKGVYVCKDGDLVLLSDKTEVINSLTSDRTDAALSAAQGKALKSQVDAKLNKSDVVNSLTSTDTAKALSAAQGKALNDKLTTTTNTANSAKSIADSIKAALTIK